MTDAGKTWRHLCSMLDDDESVWQVVGRALDVEADPWEALFDGLDEVGALAYLQNGDTGMELVDALAQLPRVFRLQPDLSEVVDTDDLADATAAADRILAASGLRLVRFVEAGDESSWPLVAVSGNQVRGIQDAALALGGEVLLPD